MISTLVLPAEIKADENPRAGTKDVTAVIRASTPTTKASPSRLTDPDRISLRVGPDRGKSAQDDIVVSAINNAANRAPRDRVPATGDSLFMNTASFFFIYHSAF
jgi:hypothetical protein